MQATELPLREIHLPDAIGWFPPAVGWCLLAIIPLLLFVGIKFYYHLTRQTALKTAKRLLADISNSPLDNAQKLRALSTLLRRVVISLSTRHDVASLTGEAWLHFLDSSLKDTAFSTGAGRCLVDAPYRNSIPSDAELSALLQLCTQWLKAQI